MRFLFWILALFALAVGFSLVVHGNDGYLLLVVPPYRTEISLNLAIVLVLAGFLLLHTVLRGVALMLSLPQRVREFRARRAREKVTERLHDVVRLFCEGRYRHALTAATEIHSVGRTPALAAMLAALAAQRLRLPEEQRLWLDHAQRADAKMQPACLMLEAEMQLEMEQPEAAVATLSRLHERAGLHLAAERLELLAQQGIGHWDEVLRIARLLEKHNVLAAAQAEEIKRRAHHENVRALQGSVSDLTRYARNLPERERTPALTRCLAEALLGQGEAYAACRLIEAQLDNAWDEPTVMLYGRARGGDADFRLANVERWLVQHTDSAGLLLAAGRIGAELARWEMAFDYLEKALALADGRDVRLELARACEQLGRADEALVHFRRATELV